MRRYELKLCVKLWREVSFLSSFLCVYVCRYFASLIKENVNFVQFFLHIHRYISYLINWFFVFIEQSMKWQVLPSASIPIAVMSSSLHSREKEGWNWSKFVRDFVAAKHQKLYEIYFCSSGQMYRYTSISWYIQYMIRQYVCVYKNIYFLMDHWIRGTLYGKNDVQIYSYMNMFSVRSSQNFDVRNSTSICYIQSVLPIRAMQWTHSYAVIHFILCETINPDDKLIKKKSHNTNVHIGVCTLTDDVFAS